ncbi:MAG: class SAM-dependent methyltransferase [Chitinophagaceae bacterium]|nr:class SAM-dependent methyltransferase [Chitinophagaceae bacterium]
MDSLRQIFDDHKDRLIHKWDNYFEVYERYFEKYRNTDVIFFEIGIAHGGSLQMWRKYFGEKAIIIAVDVNPECKQFEEGNTHVFIGSQDDAIFLNELKGKLPRVDILLDDGGHTMKQQLVTFEHMFDFVKSDGLYVCEDLHTSYWKRYGGGYKNQYSFIEFSKNIIDNLHGWHAPGKSYKKMFNHLTEKIFSIHYFDSIIVIEKRKRIAPIDQEIGVKQLNYMIADYGQRKPIKKILRSLIRSWLGLNKRALK